MIEFDDLVDLMVPWEELRSAINNLSVSQPFQISDSMNQVSAASEKLSAEFKRQIKQSHTKPSAT